MAKAQDQRAAADAAQRRKLRGAWYTPMALVDAIVAEAVFPGARTVLDPACGDGRFLAASGLPERCGVDIDASTAAQGGFICDDALRRDWCGQQWDVVLGNPPFLSQMSRLTSRGGRSAHGGGPYADAAAEFLSLAMRLCRPGGRVGLVLPQSLLSARDAAAIRTAVDRVATLRWMWWSDDAIFDGAAVRVWAAVWQIETSGSRDSGVGRSTTAPLSSHRVRRAHGRDFEELPAMPQPDHWSALLTGRINGDGSVLTLGDIATFSADFRQHYYGLVGAVGDDVDGPPLVTSGSIEPGRCLWGERPTVFAKQRFTAPRVDLTRLDTRMRAWADSRLVPKILIANQTKVIEAVHDAAGEWLPSVPVITCITNDPERVLATLTAPRSTAWVHDRAAGSGLGAGTVRLTPALLASIPLVSAPSPAAASPAPCAPAPQDLGASVVIFDR